MAKSRNPNAMTNRRYRFRVITADGEPITVDTLLALPNSEQLRRRLEDFDLRADTEGRRQSWNA
ncbi:MAG: hypothetical protein L0Y72_22380 [Gemmataceae bacterium]|nr:hypothetical protein [Gemmataceae bacterium]MCI0741790.1 hypothetical protein [Gemmataceae bacterium]